MPEPAEKEPSRHWATRLLLAVRAVAILLTSAFPRVARDRERETRQVEKYLLIVVRTYTSLDRVIELQHLLKAESGIAVKFTVQRGSKFSRALTERLLAEGAHVLPWREATRQPWDAIFAAYAHRRLAQLRGPLFCIPHGVGYNRRRFASTKDSASVGLSRYEHVRRGRLVAARIGLSHEEQRSRLCEEARDRATVIGDFVLDKLLASLVLRKEIREALGVGSRYLIVVTSTWGSCSALRAQTNLVQRLLSHLPADEYAIALVLHPNVWHGESPLEIRTQFADEIDSGLLLIEHHTWQAPLVAADLVIGDHGSVTGYAVGLDLPVLLAANGADEMDPGSPVHALHTALPRLCPRSDLRPQIEQAISGHEPGRWTSFATRIFGLPDSELVLVGVDVVDDQREGRSSSAAKNTDADFRIALARRSSRFSRSSCAIRSASLDVVPGRSPASISARLTQVRSASGWITSCSAIRLIAPVAAAGSRRASTTIWVARSRSIGVLLRCGHYSSSPRLDGLHQTRYGTPSRCRHQQPRRVLGES